MPYMLHRIRETPRLVTDTRKWPKHIGTEGDDRLAVNAYNRRQSHVAQKAQTPCDAREAVTSRNKQREGKDEKVDKNIFY